MQEAASSFVKPENFPLAGSPSNRRMPAPLSVIRLAPRTAETARLATNGTISRTTGETAFDLSATLVIFPPASKAQRQIALAIIAQSIALNVMLAKRDGQAFFANDCEF
ncbi:hypothetical protein [Roseibium sp.]|uniref:hypothetical protein n=1 Tax=Roseibium sp. TaxID=1936156 RepID=UPI003A97CCB2